LLHGLGVSFATISLIIGLFFFIFYAARYYLFTTIVLFLNLITRNRNGLTNGNENSLFEPRKKLLGFWQDPKSSHYENDGDKRAWVSEIPLVEPFISIHLPLYNEPNVAERLLAACTTLDYRNYEVIVVDDSTDETTELLRRWVGSYQNQLTHTDGGRASQAQIVEAVLSSRIAVKIVHRTNRRGFKGGALNEALKHTSPKAEFVVVFDADFIPPPDILRRFLAYFATSSPSAILNEFVDLDKRYAEGRISEEEYLTKRYALSAKLADNRAIAQSTQLADRSLFELDQLYAHGRIDEEEYLLRRKAIMRELTKASWITTPADNQLTLKQSYMICKLFSEDKVDPTDFKTRMRMILPPSMFRMKPSDATSDLFLQILELDRGLATGSIDLKTYAAKREELASLLLAFSYDPETLQANFDIDQKLARGKIGIDEYMKRRSGNMRNGVRVPKRIVHLITKIMTEGNEPVPSAANRENGANGFVAVQGYQLHFLNRSENWLTEGVRAEFSGSYMIERTCEELLGSMKMIAGSVYMIRADTLRKYGWTESLTEDWELTCRLYRDGNRVIFTPTIQAAAECPSTIKRLVRQRQRWAEGHTYNAKRYFWSILRSPNLTLREKLEFVYFAPYYLQSVFFIIGTLLWLISEFLHEYPPFWNQTLGWTLLLSNLMALPLMNLAGLLTEGTAKKDFSGVFSAIVLSYLLSIFQAYSALKGLLERREGTWIRTYKTGIITDTFRRFQVGKFWRYISKSRHLHPKAKVDRSGSPARRAIKILSAVLTTTKNSSLLVLILMTGTTSAALALSFEVPDASAQEIVDNLWQLYGSTCSGVYCMTDTGSASGSLTLTGGDHDFASDRTGADRYITSPVAAGTWTLTLTWSAKSKQAFSITWTVYISQGSTPDKLIGTATISLPSGSGPGGPLSATMSGSTQTPATTPYDILLQLTIPSGRTITLTLGSGTTLQYDGTLVPEELLPLVILMPVLPMLMSSRGRRRLRQAVRLLSRVLVE